MAKKKIAKYTIWAADWWEYDEKGNKVPATGKRNRRRIGSAETIEEAREKVRKYNETHDPGPLSRKGEFSANY